MIKYTPSLPHIRGPRLGLQLGRDVVENDWVLLWALRLLSDGC